VNARERLQAAQTLVSGLLKADPENRRLRRLLKNIVRAGSATQAAAAGNR
jgi:hypothetical protein